MQLSDFNFPFDASLVATQPVLPRDQAKLLVLSPQHLSLTHRRIADLPELLSPGDLLVVNDTRVRPARVTARKPSGHAVEVLFVKAVTERDWEVLIKGSWRPGQVLVVGTACVLAVLVFRSWSDSAGFFIASGPLTGSGTVNMRSSVQSMPMTGR